MHTINLTHIQIADLNGNTLPLEELPKDVGNLIFINATSIEVSDIARTLHKGETAELSTKQLREVIEVVKQNPPYRAFATLQVLEYLNKQLQNPIKTESEVK